MPSWHLFAGVADCWKEISVLFVTFIFVIYAFFKYKFSYWKRHGFPFIEGTIPTGSLTNFLLGNSSISETLEKLYKETPGLKYVGYYSLWTPTLLIRDPELLRNILVKDFYYFYDRGMYCNDKDDPLSGHLFGLNGVKWKTTRAKLTVMFGSPKIKLHFIAMKACVLQLNEFLKETLDNGEDVVNFKELISRHSVNVIANTAIGVEGHSIKEKSHLYEMAIKVTEPTLTQSLRFGVAMLAKDFARLISMRLTPKPVERYYLDLTKNIVEYRSKNDIKRNDFMGSLIELWDKNISYEKELKPDDETSLSLRDVAAQTFLFVLAAYESTSSTICFALYELAHNQKLQDKLIAEVDAVGSAEEITYEQLVELKYLTMVLNETWRLYPPAGMLLRECGKNYVLPDWKVLQKGISITVPLAGIHKDPQYFPDPETFDPERFNKDSPSYNIQPYTYFPFGEGQRNCIGKRYGVIQTMITLFTLISNYRFEIAPETNVPPRIDPKVFVTQPEGGMPLKVIFRK